jgi:hypothetical protein
VATTLALRHVRPPCPLVQGNFKASYLLRPVALEMLTSGYSVRQEADTRVTMCQVAVLVFPADIRTERVVTGYPEAGASDEHVVGSVAAAA